LPDNASRHESNAFVENGLVANEEPGLVFVALGGVLRGGEARYGLGFLGIRPAVWRDEDQISGILQGVIFGAEQ
jgi:hypothetical protein